MRGGTTSGCVGPSERNQPAKLGALYAGESVSHVRSVEPAAAIMAELIAGAEQLLREAAAR